MDSIMSTGMVNLLRKGQTGSEILWILENLISENPSPDFLKVLAKHATIQPTDQPIDF
jgi:hypothetical protein